MRPTIETRAVEFRLTAKDVLASIRLDQTERRRKWRDFSIWAFVFVALLLAVRQDYVWLAMLPVGLVLTGLAYWFAELPRRARRFTAKHDLNAAPIMLTLEEDGLRIQTPSDDRLFIWSSCFFWRTNAAMTIVYVSSGQYVRVPERIAAHGFPMADLKAVLWHHLGSPGRRAISGARRTILNTFD